MKDGTMSNGFDNERAHAYCTSCSVCGAGGYWEDDNE